LILILKTIFFSFYLDHLDFAPLPPIIYVPSSFSSFALLLSFSSQFSIHIILSLFS